MQEEAAIEKLRVLAEVGSMHAIGADDARPLAGDDLKAMQASGHPWRELEAVASAILEIEEQGIDLLALELLAPDDDLRGKLFHLGVCGEMLYGLQDLGCMIESVRPIGDGRAIDKPAFRTLHAGVEWEIWFESAAVWKKAGVSQPYAAATKALVRRGRTLSADLLLIDRIGRRALMIECKDSFDATYVGRGGYHQATTYLVEAHSRLSDETVSIVVGHDGAVDGISLIPLAGGLVGLAESGRVAEIVRRFVIGADLAL